MLLMRYFLIFCLIILQLSSFGQRKPPKEYKVPKFGHQPFLVLKLSPQDLLLKNNAFVFGGEIAPPFGKFSFALDYGKGHVKNNINADIRNDFPDQTNKIIRGEIRGYFSDWYYFHSLDMKPLGRYYALEIFQNSNNRTQTAEVLVPDGNQFKVVENKVPFTKTATGFHVKYGKNFIISRFFMIDTYIGVGAKMNKYTDQSESISDEIAQWQNQESKYFWQPLQKTQYQPSFTAGFRLCVPL